MSGPCWREGPSQDRAGLEDLPPDVLERIAELGFTSLLSPLFDRGDLLHQACTLACVGNSTCTSLAQLLFAQLSARLGGLRRRVELHGKWRGRGEQRASSGGGPGAQVAGDSAPTAAWPAFICHSQPAALLCPLSRPGAAGRREPEVQCCPAESSAERVGAVHQRQQASPLAASAGRGAAMLPLCHWQRLHACPSFNLLRTVAHTVQSHAHIPLTLHVCVPPCRCRTANRMQAATRQPTASSAVPRGASWRGRATAASPSTKPRTVSTCTNTSWRGCPPCEL